MLRSTHLCLLTAVLVAHLHAGVGLRKHWRLSWNLEDEANWAGGSVLCPGQRLQLPSRLDFSTYLSASLRIEQLSLPETGEIIFGEKGTLELGRPERRPAHCGTDSAKLTWSHQGRDLWWDPLAWSIPDPLRVNESAVPDLSRVPCTTDTVVLQPNLKYLSPIHFTPPVARVTSVVVNGQSLTTSDLLDYASQNVSGQLTGSSVVHGDLLLYAEEDPHCTGGRDCVCAGSEAPELLHQAVCGNRRLPCPEPHCDQPVQMRDFCCLQCGVDFTLPSSYTGDGRRLESLLKAVDARAATRGVSRYVGLMTDLRYHVYVVGRDEEGDYAAVADIVRGILGEDIGGKDALEVAAAGASAYMQRENQRNLTGGLVSAFVIISFLALLLYFMHKKGYTRALLRAESPGNFQFRRMSMVAIRRISRIPLHADVLSGRRASEAHGGHSADTAAPVPSYSVQSGGLRFMNPVFSKSTASLAAMPIDPEGGMGVGAAGDLGEVENRMYGAFMHMTPEEKEAYDDSTSSCGAAQAPPKPPRSDDKEQGMVRFSQLGTIEEDAPPIEDDDREAVGTRAGPSSNRQVNVSVNKLPATVESQLIDADFSGKDHEPLNDENISDTKIVIEVHSAAQDAMEVASRAAVQRLALTDIQELPTVLQELPTVEQVQEVSNSDGNTGINFGFEDDD